jgi:hypothetical protein
MKFPGLCLLLLCLFATSAAQSPSDPQKSGRITVQDSPSADEQPLRDLGWGARIARRHTADFYCAYMRTYRIQRKSRDSDLVSPAGYTTCVPTERFELRSTVQIQTEPARRE